MRRFTPLAVSLLCLITAVTLAQAGTRSSRADARMRLTAAAASFLNTLRPDLRTKATVPFDDRARTDWHFVPRDRPGVRLREMNDAERATAHGLLRAALSSRGYLKTDSIMQLDQVLRDLSIAAGREDTSRDPLQYTFTIFGAPSAETPWGWRIEGHHISLNFTVTPATMVATTPAFLGAAPAEIRSGSRAGFRPLAAEDDLGHELLASLNETQRKKAVLTTEVPRDITAIPGRSEGDLKDSGGLPITEMTPPQRAILDRLIEEFVRNMQDDIAAPHLERIRADTDKTTFAWVGSAEPGKLHYYRLRAPRWIIEYDTTQNDPGHIHTVWRDFDHDFGGDLLKQHYHGHEHGAQPDH